MKPNVTLVLFLLFMIALCRFSTPMSMTTGPISFPVKNESVEPTPASISSSAIEDCDDDSCLNICLARISQVLEKEKSEQLTTYKGLDAKFDLLLYDVDNGQLGEPTILYVPQDFRKYQEDLDAPLRVWNYFSALVPESQMKWFTSFTVYADNGSSDTLAYVASINNDREHWELGVDIVNADNPISLTYTLVHELGHVITMNTDQIPYDEYGYGWHQYPEICPQFLYETGCSNADSYMNLFYQAFWVDILDEWRTNIIEVDPREDVDEDTLVHEFYLEHQDMFLREYAATNILEDMAVTFEAFILKPKPTGTSITDQKINFYYDFPELVEMRTRMIKAMCIYTVE